MTINKRKKYIDLSNLKCPLPLLKTKLLISELSSGDEIEVTAELKALKKVSSGQQEYEVTTRLKKAILSVDGNDDTAHVNSFVENNPTLCTM